MLWLILQCNYALKIAAYLWRGSLNQTGGATVLFLMLLRVLDALPLNYGVVFSEEMTCCVVRG